MTSTVLTPSQTAGPLWGFALMFPGSEDMVDPASAGAIALEGRITDADGPFAWPQGLIEVWSGSLWARSRTDRDGVFHFVVAKPEPEVLDPDTVLAPYLEVAIFGPGLLNQLRTRMYFPDDRQAHEVDPVLRQLEPNERELLIARPTDEGLRFDICFQGERETPFFMPPAVPMPDPPLREG
jgi:protocatechuate 3,4-dioxygenase, alpha subunit